MDAGNFHKCPENFSLEKNGVHPPYLSRGIFQSPLTAGSPGIGELALEPSSTGCLLLSISSGKRVGGNSDIQVS